jgi:plastocyanin
MLNKLTFLVVVAGAACSSKNKGSIDAPPRDAPKVFMDAPHVFMDAPHVFMDAPVPSTVIVVPNCTGVANKDIGANIGTTAADTFLPTTATFTHGKYVKFTTAGTHNFQNQPGAAADAMFVSGPAGAQTTCLQFTVAGTFPFVVHAAMGMKGTLTVN